MTKIRPLRAVIYNQEKVGGLKNVVCPPYDVISGSQQDAYHARSPYNLIYLELGKDIAGEDKYHRAGVYFKEWLKARVLTQEESPAAYFYSQQYNLKGEKKTRFGFIALLKLEENASCIFGHERTRVEAKEDRLKLLRAVKANLSPIFVIFSDKKRIIPSLHQEYLSDKKPFIEVADDEGTVHKLWRINDPAVIEKISLALEGSNIFIADGHHRYEVSCAYRQEMNRRKKQRKPEEGFDYVLAYFTSVESRDLTIMPIHRLAKISREFSLEAFLKQLQVNFDVEEVKDKDRLFLLMQRACGSGEHLLGMYREKRYWLLRFKNTKVIDKVIIDKPAEYRQLDVSVLNYLVLRDILGIPLEDKERIFFSHNADELVRRTDQDNSSIAFFLNPVRIQQIMDVALKGEKMPAKSTYFYPKVLSGLVIHKHD